MAEKTTKPMKNSSATGILIAFIVILGVFMFYYYYSEGQQIDEYWEYTFVVIMIAIVLLALILLLTRGTLEKEAEKAGGLSKDDVKWISDHLREEGHAPLNHDEVRYILDLDEEEERPTRAGMIPIILGRRGERVTPEDELVIELNPNSLLIKEGETSKTISYKLTNISKKVLKNIQFSIVSDEKIIRGDDKHPRHDFIIKVVGKLKPKGIKMDSVEIPLAEGIERKRYNLRAVVDWD